MNKKTNQSDQKDLEEQNLEEEMSQQDLKRMEEIELEEKELRERINQLSNQNQMLQELKNLEDPAYFRMLMLGSLDKLNNNLETELKERQITNQVLKGIGQALNNIGEILEEKK